ncbi:beta-2 adrenergic receptor-like [Littorina saxatilis]|uniref:beta-2 adrenergic receptor-like n=1 Tax=Littorina saxatilis TaxID=31220 RepID=UPI0038B50B5D
MTINDTTQQTLGAGPNVTTPTTLVEWSTDNKMRNVLIGSVLVIVNALTLITVVRTRSLRSHTKMLVGSLTCSDMLMGVSTLVPRLLPWQHLSHEPMCVIRFSGVLMSVYGTCLSVISISLDRTLALTFPIMYRLSISVVKALLAVLGVWGMSALLTVASLADGFPDSTSCDMILVMSSRGLLLVGYVVLASIVAIATLYVYIGVRLRRRRRRVGVQLSARRPGGGVARNDGGDNAVEGGGGGAVDGDGGDYQAVSMKMEHRTTVTATVLVVSFLFGYLPMASYLLWAVHSGADLLEEAKAQRLLIIIACPLINCILDPLVYFWRLQNWQAEVFGKCRKLAQRNSSSSTSGVPITQNTR